MNSNDTQWFTFKGRSCRNDYLLGLSPFILAALPISGLIASGLAHDPFCAILIGVLIVACICVLIPVSVRRAHDLGWCGACAWNFLSLLFKKGNVQSNTYGNPPTTEATKPFFTFTGRARRSEYWSVAIVSYLIMIFVAGPFMLFPIISVFTGDVRSFGVGGGICFIVGSLIALACGIAMWPVSVRRFHDRSMSGWWMLWFGILICIPYIGGLASIIEFVILGCLDGVPGPNEYGPDLKGRCWVQGINRQHIGKVNRDTIFSAEDRLAKLAELKRSGVLSEAEYEMKRSQILAEL